MAVNDVTIFRDPDTGDVGLKDKSSGNKFLWSSDRQEWFLEDQSGERPVGGPKGTQNVSVTDYSVETKDGNRRLLVETDTLLNFSSELSPTGSIIQSVSYNKSNGKLAVGSGDGTLLIYDDNLNLVNSTDTIRTPSSISWNTQSNKLAVTINTSTDIFVFPESLDGNGSFGEITRFGLSGSGDVIDVAWNSNNGLIAGSIDTEVEVWDKNDSTGNYEHVKTLDDASDGTSYISWNLNDNRLAFGSQDTNAYVYDSNLNLTNTLTDPSDFTFGVDWNPNDDRLAVNSDESIVYIYDTNLNLLDTVDDPTDFLNHVEWESELGRLAVGSFDNNVYVYDTDLNLVNTLTEPTGDINDLSWDENIGRLFVSNDDETVFRNYTTRNKVDIASDNPDYFETTVVNSGDWIVEIESSGATLNSLVGSEPKIIDQWGEATVRKTGSSEYLVEGDIYEETGDGFTQSL